MSIEKSRLKQAERLVLAVGLVLGFVFLLAYFGAPK